jgi:hypothetical protein
MLDMRCNHGKQHSSALPLRCLQGLAVYGTEQSDDDSVSAAGGTCNRALCV